MTHEERRKRRRELAGRLRAAAGLRQREVDAVQNPTDDAGRGNPNRVTFLSGDPRRVGVRV